MSVGVVVALFAVLPILPFIDINGFSTVIPFVPIYLSLFLIGTEWTFREPDAVSEFLRSNVGKASMLVGVTHAVVGIVLQFYTRDIRFVHSSPHIPQEIPDIIFFIEDALGLALVSVFLSAVIVIPALLWYRNRLLTPVMVVTVWVVLGVWLNYIYPYPANEIRGLGAGFSPAPDYAVKVYIPLLLMLTAAIFEGGLRQIHSKLSCG